MSKKASMVPPPIVKRRLKKILKALVSPAERNFDDKVKRLTNREIIPVWERKKKSDSIFYSINREHPFIKEFLEKLDQFYIDKFERILYLIDFGVPVEGIYADFSDDKNINEIETNALNDLITLAREMIHYISRQDNINEKQAKLSISTSEPFRSNWAEIEEHL